MRSPTRISLVEQPSLSTFIISLRRRRNCLIQPKLSMSSISHTHQSLIHKAELLRLGQILGTYLPMSLKQPHDRKLLLGTCHQLEIQMYRNGKQYLRLALQTSNPAPRE